MGKRWPNVTKLPISAGELDFLGRGANRENLGRAIPLAHLIFQESGGKVDFGLIEGRITYRVWPQKSGFLSPHLEIFADRVCKGNPGPGGHGATLKHGKNKRDLKVST